MTNEHEQDRRPILIARWLLAVCLMILGMIVLGGITRLTGSGLSITEWKPIMGAIPPLGEAQWLEAFEKYKLIPQYQLINRGMSLAQFKWIFFWEYTHRLLGRSIGLVYVLPWIWYSRRGWISRRLHKRLALGLCLFGLQGLMGWIMVASGLSERTSVSHYRLAAHLTLALAVMGYMLWVIRGELGAPRPRPDAKASERALADLAFGVKGLLALVALQIVYGAFMAGLKAGFMYSTFPTMNGEWFPEAALRLEPRWLNFLENPAAVHFMHRTLGYLVVAGALGLWTVLLRYRRELPRSVRVPAIAGAHATFLQFALGVLTVHTHVAIPVAVSHQICGALILFALVWALLTLRSHEAAQARC